MTKLFHYIFGCLSILIFLNVNSSAQNIKEDIILQPGQTVEREMTGKETHRYKFTLKKDEFFQVRVEQKDVDIMLKLLDFGATILATMNSPNSIEGFETLSYIADKNGEFILEIIGFDEKAEKGSYTINCITTRTATSIDKKRVETERIFVEGMKARDIEGQGETALTKLEQSLNGWREIKDEYLIQRTTQQINNLKKAKADAIFNEALYLYQQGTAESYQSALESFQQAIRIYEVIGDKGEDSGIAVLASGLISDNLGRKQDALRFYDKALKLFHISNFKNWEATTLNNIGSVYSSLGEKQKALENFSQSLSLRKTVNDKSGVARTLNNIGLIYYSLREMQKALEYYNQALPIFKTVSDKAGEATTLSNIGNIYSSLGEKKKAFEYFNQSLSLSKTVGDKSGEGKNLSDIGSVHDSLGEKQKALEFYNQALPIFKNVGNKAGEAMILSNIGLVYSSLGEKQKALELFNQALSLTKGLEDNSGEATILSNIGLVYDSLGEKQKALELFNQALLLIKAVGDKSQEAKTLSNIGLVYDSLGEKQKALDYYNQALPLSKAIGDKAVEATILSNIGLVYDLLGEKQKALELFNQSLTLIKSVGDKSQEAITLNNVMVALHSLGNQKLAAFYGKQSVNLFQQLRTNIKGLDKEIQQTYTNKLSRTYRDLSNILIADGRLLEAQAILDLLKEEEFSGLTRRGGDEAENVPYSKAEEAALKVLEKLAVLGREKSELDDKNLKGILTEIERQRFKELQKHLELAEVEFKNSLDELSAETNKIKNYDAVVKDAQAFMSTLKELGNGTVALYTVIVNDAKPTLEGIQPKNSTAEKIKTGWIILVTPEFRKAYPVDVTNLEQTIAKFRRTLISPHYDPLPFARQLYKKMFLQTSDKQKTTLAADLDEYFKNKTNKTLMWSLDGIFRYVPIAALHDGEQYLVGKYRNTIFNTASKDRLKDAVKPNWTALGLGVSVGRTESGKAFSALPGAKRELLKIVRQNNSSGIIKGTIKLDEQFTDETMFDALSFDKHPLVHIASHFSYQIADFNESFLLLGKGKLTVKDMSVKSNLFSNVDLLTLSACETAVPNANGRDVEGFAFIAQRLGAKSVMATLWQVDDIGTQVLMPEFYRLRETGLGKGEALRRVQLDMLRGKIKDIPDDVKRSDVIILDGDKSDLQLYKQDNSKPFAHPFYWSPFVLIGNWR